MMDCAKSQNEKKRAKELFKKIILTGDPESLIEFYALTNHAGIKLRSIGITPEEVRKALVSVNIKLEEEESDV
jgi:hypothetical protein